MKINHHINAATKMRLLMTLLLTSTIMGAGNQGGGGCGSSSGNSNNSPSNTGQAPSGGSVDLSINITPKDPAADYGKCMTNTSAPTQICSQPSPSPSPALINYVQGWRCGGFSAAMCSSISADRAAEEEARCMDYHNGYVSADPMVRQEAKNMCTLYPVTWGDSTFYCRCPEWIIKDAAIQSSVYNPPLAGFSTPVGQVSCMTGGDQMFCQVIGPSIAPTPSPSTTPHCYNTEDMDRLISNLELQQIAPGPQKQTKLHALTSILRCKL